MDAGLLTKLFGNDQRWHGACTVIMRAEAAMRTHGSDSIVSGGVKMFAPRTVSGRINADAVCLLDDHSALLIIQQQKQRLESGEDCIKQFLTVAAVAEVAAIEFLDTVPLIALGICAPVLSTRPSSFSHQGVSLRPM